MGDIRELGTHRLWASLSVMGDWQENTMAR